jgi:hypothetical protein
VHVKTGHALAQGRQTFHDDAPESKVLGGTQGHRLWPAHLLAAVAAKRRAGELDDSSNQTIRFGHFMTLQLVLRRRPS